MFSDVKQMLEVASAEMEVHTYMYTGVCCCMTRIA